VSPLVEIKRWRDRNEFGTKGFYKMGNTWMDVPGCVNSLFLVK
jgi:hypothetical protein